MSDETIPYASQTLDETDYAAVLDSLKNNWITRGPRVESFEEELKKECGSQYCVVFPSGSLALEAAFYAAKITQDDVVVSSPNTFVGTLAGALKTSHHLQLLDIDPKSRNVSFNSFKACSDRRHLLVPVYHSGYAEIPSHSLDNALVIEDACQAFGSLYPNGVKVGSCAYSDLCVFSFHPAKTLCMGEGGAVMTNDLKLYERLLLFRNNGIVKDPEALPWVYEVHDNTTNANVTDFAAALGSSQLRKLEFFLQKRKQCVEIYRSYLKKTPYITLPTTRYELLAAHNLFVIEVDFESAGWTRAELMEALKEQSIATQVHFIPLYHHPYFKKHFSFDPADFPQMERYYRKALSLPLYAHLRPDQIQKVCQTLQSLLLSRRSLVGHL